VYVGSLKVILHTPIYSSTKGEGFHRIALRQRLLPVYTEKRRICSKYLHEVCENSGVRTGSHTDLTKRTKNLP
jgi:hypothetical protein